MFFWGGALIKLHDDDWIEKVKKMLDVYDSFSI